jgi:hypothetical protein
MGLDVTAYKNLKKVDNPQIDKDGDLVNWDTEWRPGASMEWSESVWPGRGKGVEAKTVYSYEEDYDFRAGSYSGYNYWREQLACFKGEVAFQELVDFADNEGVIGPVVSKKLAKEFSDYEEEAKEFSKTLGENGDWWFEKYLDWKKAFEMAIENGAVDFH